MADYNDLFDLTGKTAVVTGSWYLETALCSIPLRGVTFSRKVREQKESGWKELFAILDGPVDKKGRK